MQNSFWLARKVLLTFFLVRWYGYSWGIKVILRIKAPENAFILQPSQQEQRCLEERYVPLPYELDYWNNDPEESEAFPGVSRWAKEKTSRQTCPSRKRLYTAVIFSLPLFSPCPDFLLVSLLSLIVFGAPLPCLSVLPYVWDNPEAQVGTGGNWLSVFLHTFKLSSQKNPHRTHQLDIFICSSQCGQTELISFLCFSPSHVVIVHCSLCLKTCGWV